MTVNVSMTRDDEWQRLKNENLNRAQAQVDLEVAAGNHPFQMLAKLNQARQAPMGEFLVLHAIYRTGIQHNQSQRQYDSVQLSLLEKAGPYWDLAANHFKGKTFMRFECKRILTSLRYELKVFLCFDHVDDFDTFKIMVKLNDLPECINLEY